MTVEEFHAFADVAAEAARQSAKVSCRGKGCNGCCRGEIPVADEEADLIASVLTPAQAARVLRFETQEPERARCPLLEADGTCDVYGARPFVCRTYQVTSLPELCWPELVGPARITKVISNPAVDVLEQLYASDLRLIPALKARITNKKES